MAIFSQLLCWIPVHYNLCIIQCFFSLSLSVLNLLFFKKSNDFLNFKFKFWYPDSTVQTLKKEWKWELGPHLKNLLRYLTLRRINNLYSPHDSWMRFPYSSARKEVFVWIEYVICKIFYSCWVCCYCLITNSYCCSVCEVFLFFLLV